MPEATIRQIPRDKLFAVFKSWELVQLVESLLHAVGTTLPDGTEGVQQNLDSHIAEGSGAHAASAISNEPAGDIVAGDVQAALNELDTKKQPAAALLTALAALVTAEDKLPYFTGPDAVATTDFTDFARSLLSDPDAAAVLTTLGVSAFVQTMLDDPDAEVVMGTLGIASVVSAWLSSPTAANLRAAVSYVTGSGALVFGTSPTLADPVLAGSIYRQQGAPASKSAAATLTAAEIRGGIIQYTGATANLTLPTGANIEGGVLPGLAVDLAFEFAVINTGTGAATLVTAAGLTLVGSMAVANGTSGRFSVRKTAANAYTVYRIA